MTLEQIKSAVDAGKTVHWTNTSYTVIKDKCGRYLVAWGSNYIGLTWGDETTLNGKPEEFFLGEP